MVEAKRKKGETFESFLRRFNKRLIQSGKVLQYKKIKFKKRNPSKNLQKQVALYRIKENEKRDYLKKIGRLADDDFRKKGRR